jgi:hypothetical protein
MEIGRKFISLIISFGLLVVGLILTNKMNMTVEWFEAYAKWIIIGLAVFTGGNGAITISSLLSHKNGGEQ